jgi:hypothetical protein
VSAIAIPEESSAALLILKPLESFSRELLNALLFILALTCELSEAMFVFILKLMINPS